MRSKSTEGVLDFEFRRNPRLKSHYLRLTNMTNDYVAFKVEQTEPKGTLWLKIGVLYPDTVYILSVAKHYEANMKWKYEFKGQVVVSPDYAAVKRLGSHMVEWDKAKHLKSFEVSFSGCGTPNTVSKEESDPRSEHGSPPCSEYESDPWSSEYESPPCSDDESDPRSEYESPPRSEDKIRRWSLTTGKTRSKYESPPCSDDESDLRSEYESPPRSEDESPPRSGDESRRAAKGSVAKLVQNWPPRPFSTPPLEDVFYTASIEPSSSKTSSSRAVAGLAQNWPPRPSSTPPLENVFYSASIEPSSSETSSSRAVAELVQVRPPRPSSTPPLENVFYSASIEPSSSKTSSSRAVAELVQVQPPASSPRGSSSPPRAVVSTWSRSVEIGRFVADIGKNSNGSGTQINGSSEINLHIISLQGNDNKVIIWN